MTKRFQSVNHFPLIPVVDPRHGMNPYTVFCRRGCWPTAAPTRNIGEWMGVLEPVSKRRASLRRDCMWWRS